MSKFHNNWRDFLVEGSFKEKKLLREITEDELEHIEKALDEMNPEDLAFNDLFDGKNRVLIPFPTQEEKSELGQFVAFFRKTGLDVDWDKGIVSGTISISDRSPEGMARALSAQQGMASLTKHKKVQMKVGKFLSKLKRDVEKLRVLRERLKEWLFEKGPYRAGVMDGRSVYTTYIPRMTGDDVKEALDNNEEDVRQYYRLKGQVDGYVNDDTAVFNDILLPATSADRLINRPDKMTHLAQYWQQKADWIKKNLSSIEENKYSILITRHPVDILRMSDFDDINSCHSPPSRPQAEGSYYKCAVAEAHGHGAIAYVVNNSDLEEEFGTGNLRAIEESSAFQQNQDFFYDDARDAGAEIEPVSRLRLRQVRHFKETSKWTATGRPVEEPGVQIAVPEKRVYGVKVPGFREKVVAWARENQTDAMLSAPRDDAGNVKLDNFIKYGGSYEDNFIGPLTKDLYEDNRFKDFAMGFTGNIKQDVSTQRELERTLVLTNLDRVQREAEEVLRSYNLRHFEVELDYDEEEGNAFIIPTVQMTMDFDTDEWIAGDKGRAILTYLTREFEDYGEGWDIFGTGGYDVGYERELGRVRMKVRLDKLGDLATWMTPGDLDELLSALYDIEGRKYEGFKMIATGYLMREGALDGGEVDRLGWAAENDDLDSGDWDVETEEGDHEPHRYELVTANMRLEISFENTTGEMLNKIIDEREFWLGIRTIMTKKSRGAFASDYQVDMDRFLDDIDDEEKVLYFRLNYHIGGGDKDDIARAWKALIETWNDEEELGKMIQDQFNKWVRAYGGPVIKNAKGERMVESKLKIRSKSQEQRMFDKWRRFLR